MDFGDQNLSLTQKPLNYPVSIQALQKLMSLGIVYETSPPPPPHTSDIHCAQKVTVKGAAGRFFPNKRTCLHRDLAAPAGAENQEPLAAESKTESTGMIN